MSSLFFPEGPLCLSEDMCDVPGRRNRAAGQGTARRLRHQDRRYCAKIAAKTDIDDNCPHPSQTVGCSRSDGLCYTRSFYEINGSFPGSYTLRSRRSERITDLIRAVLGSHERHVQLQHGAWFVSLGQIEAYDVHVRYFKNLCATPAQPAGSRGHPRRRRRRRPQPLKLVERVYDAFTEGVDDLLALPWVRLG